MCWIYKEQAVFKQLADVKWLQEVESHSIKNLQELSHNKDQQ